jgi:hypothetical protein
MFDFIFSIYFLFIYFLNLLFEFVELIRESRIFNVNLYISYIEINKKCIEK